MCVYASLGIYVNQRNMFGALAYDLVHIIINYVCDLEDFLKLRLLNQSLARDCLRYWHSLTPIIVHPQSTMVSMRICMVCNCEGEMKEAQVIADQYPRRVFMHCDKMRCCHSTIQSLKHAICRVNQCRIVQNWRTFLPKKIMIKRSSGTMQEAEPFPFYLYLLNHRTWVRADFTDNNIECSKLVAYEEHKIEDPKVIVF